MRVILLLLLLVSPLAAEDRSIRVFIALCDNKTQGIIKVGEKIGNGDDPDSNLYWGCSDGFGSWFRRSSKWEAPETENDVSPAILRRMTLRHKEEKITLIADAYRGSEIRNCYLAFEEALASKEHDLVAFIGHNVLMDTLVLEAEPVSDNPTKAIILACLSESFFSPRLERLGAEPILLTSQLMYPGAFLLHDAIEAWRTGGSKEAIRKAAGRAYSRNQGISVSAGTGIFAKLPENQTAPTP